MRFTLHIVSFVVLVSTNFVFCQISNNHDRAESVLSEWPLKRVIDAISVSERYDTESQIESFIDSSYLIFQNIVNQTLLENPELTASEEADLISSFLYSLKGEIFQKPIIKDKPNNTVKVLNGPCVNMDFEAGNLTGWTLQRGTRTSANLYDFSSPVNVGAGANHLICNGGVDPVVGIPRVGPGGGTFSVRLGNGTTTGSGAARMTQSFLVDPSNM